MIWLIVVIFARWVGSGVALGTLGGFQGVEFVVAGCPTLKVGSVIF